MQKYTFSGYIKLILDILYTKIFFNNARIIRYPFYLRNNGAMDLGNNLTTGVALRIDIISKNSKLIIGNNLQINDYCHIGVLDEVRIGDNVLIASKVFITDHSHGNYSNLTGDLQSSPEQSPIERVLVSSPVSIEDNVWIGENVSILPGVTIGRGAIISSNSVVSKDVAPYTIAGGVPVKPLKRFCTEQECWIKVD